MSTREEIQPNPKNKGWRRLSYTSRCGWVDWGHALPGNASELKRKIEAKKNDGPYPKNFTVTLEGAPAFAFHFGQHMKKFGVTLDATSDWVVRKNLSKSEQDSAALGIFREASVQFEAKQASFPYSVFSDSGFSQEDLVSDEIGFYMVFKAVSEKAMRSTCGETSVEESDRIWMENFKDRGIGSIKNHQFMRPNLYPIKADSNSCTDTSMPSVLVSIKPMPAGSAWVNVKGSLKNCREGSSIDVSASGDIKQSSNLRGRAGS